MISPKEALVTTLLYLSVLPLLSGLVCGASASVFSAGSRRQDVADSFEAIVRPRNLAASADALSLSQTTNFPRDLAPAGAELCKVGQPCADGRYVNLPLGHSGFTKPTIVVVVPKIYVVMVQTTAARAARQAVLLPPCVGSTVKAARSNVG